MADLYGRLKGLEKLAEVTRRGKDSMTGSVRGWNVGVTLEARRNSNGKVVIRIYVDGGSDHPSRSTLLATVTESSVGGIVQIELDDGKQRELTIGGS